MNVITSTSDLVGKKNIINRVAYVPAGCSIDTSKLVAGSVLLEGTPISNPTSGVRSICKQAVVLTGSTTTAIKVAELTHHFKVGDFIGTKSLGKAYAITGIVNASGVDTITVGTAIDTPVVGGFIYEMAAEAATDTSALKNTAKVVLANGLQIASTAYVIAMADVLTRADVHAGVIATEYLATLNVEEITY